MSALGRRGVAGGRERLRIVLLGAAAAVAGTVLLAASGWLVTRAAERPPVLALLAAIVVVRALGLVRAFGRYGERLAAHDLAFRQLAELRVGWYRRLIARPRRDLRTFDPVRGGQRSAGHDGGPAGDAAALPAADLLSRFVVDVDELQHRDVRVRGPLLVALVASLTATALAAVVLPVAGMVLGAGLLAGAIVPSALAFVSARGALRRQGEERAALVDELVETMDAAPQLALAGRGAERLGRLDAASARLSRIARRDAAASALAQGLGTLIAGVTLIAVLAVAIDPAAAGTLDPVWLGALALLALGAFEPLAPLPEAATRAVSVAAAERRLAQAAPPIAQGAPPTAQAAPPIAQGAPPTAQAAPPIAQDAPPTAQAAPPIAQGAPPTAQAAPPIAQAAPRFAQAAPPFAQAAPPSAQAAPRFARAAPRSAEAVAEAAVLLTARGIRHRPGGAGAAVVLDGVDLTLRAGERAALIGPSGAGKTVLVQLLAGLTAADEGEIALGGRPLGVLAPEELRAGVRLAGQDAHLFATSIANNVRIGAPEADDAQVEAALRATGLGPWLDALPDGVGTLVGEEGFAVSGGQRQRIALARCLVSPARLLLLDEPTAMLDPPAARAFLTDLDRAVGDRGVLVITHERIGLDRFDTVHELRDGRLVTVTGGRVAPTT
ncbi:ATP-binding cassette domain-containing protein [Conexibacter sp. JD483]|uniref:amino acid ABC transporter ATP-binding/permease protein n=1 Tax=Conexibacter sp. JD483 TaxID=3064471 RepID=UPI002870AD1F|nr:ATP-binding cassette domain-containing protein [Conexibacter sp. JD483]MDR9370929.1 ATP-binding cassette domain-containing protein [Conexibacter sp. JD483]